MKRLSYIAMLFAVAALASCEKKDYPKGLPELEHHYYAVFVPNNNSAVSVSKSQSALLKFPVQFYSTFIRDYDAVAKYIVVPDATSPAAVGVDFNIVDKNGNTIQPTGGSYTITFPQAKQAMDTIYIKLLNNPASGSRKMEVQLQDNITDKFDVDIFSTAYRRPVEIK